MFEAITNFAKVAASTGYDDNDTAITLATGDGARLPDTDVEGQFRLVWWNATDYADPSDDPNREVILVTDRDGDDLTVVRGMDGTTASNKNTGGKTYWLALAVLRDTADRWSSNLGEKKKRAAKLGTLDSHGVSMFSAGRTRFALDVHGNILIGYAMDDISKARTAGNFDATSTTGDSRGGVTFNAEGTKMYVLSDDDIYQFSLSTPWDVTTASYDTVTAALTGNDRHSPRFNPDGTTLLVIDDANNRVEEYTLSTPWDLSTLSAGSTFAVSGSPTGFDVSPDGKYFYVAHDGVGGDGAYQYEMRVPWDITSAYEVGFLSITSNNPEGLAFNPSGTRLYCLSDFSPEGIMEFALTKPWDITTGSFVQTFTLPGNLQDDIIFSPHGHRIYIREISGGTIVQYDLYDGGYQKVGALTAEMGARISGTERYMRIDSSGNFIVSGANMTVSDTALAFLSVFNLSATALSFIPASSADDVVGTFGSSTNVRTLFRFYRNNTTVGQITTHNSMLAFGYSTNVADMVINQSGRVQIAHATNRGTNGGYLLINPHTDHRNALADTYLQMVGDGAGLHILQDAANTAPWHIFRHSTGSIGTPAATASGNFIGGLLSYAYDTAAFNLVGRLAFNALGTMTTSDWGTRLLVYGVAAGTISLQAAAQIGVGNSIFTDALITAPLSSIVGTHVSKNIFTGAGSPNNSYAHFWHRANTNGVGVAISFNVSTTTDNLGALIVHRRTGANSQGVLEFYTKNSTTGGAAPVLALTLDENQNAAFEEDITATDITAAGKLQGQVAINTQTGTTYTLALTDNCSLVDCDNTDPITVTVPDNSDIALPIGAKILIRQKGTGQVTLAEDTSVTIDCALSLSTLAQYSVVGLVKIGTDLWVAFGDFEPL